MQHHLFALTRATPFCDSGADKLNSSGRSDNEASKAIPIFEAAARPSLNVMGLLGAGWRIDAIPQASRTRGSNPATSSE
jgi:hypothetical protein